MSDTSERRYFKLPTGYMHVDGRGIAFTRSGNWEEAVAAKERVSRASVGRIVRVVVGIGLILVGLVFYAMKGLRASTGMAFVIAAAGAAFGVYKLLNSVKDDLAESFAIPFAKVRSLEPTGRGLRIKFVNGGWKEDEVNVQLPEAEATWVQAAWASQCR